MRLFLTLSLISLLLAACSPNVVLLTREPEPTPTKTLTPRPSPTAPTPTPLPPTEIPLNTAALSGIRVTLWHGLDGNTGATLRKLAAEFSQKNEWGIQVEVVSQKNLPLLLETLSTVARTPQQPDLVLALPENAQGWEAQGLVTDLAPYIRHSKVGLSTEEIQDIPAAFWEQNQIKSNAITKQLSAPAMRSGRFLFYNVTFAKSLGFTAAPLSADEFRQQACAANTSWKTDADLTNDGFGGLVIENAMTDLDSAWTAYGWLRAHGSDVYRDGKFNFFTPENEAAIEFLADLRGDDCVWLSIATSGYDALAQHKALFVAGSLQNLRQQQAAFAGLTDEWTVIAFPGVTPTMLTYGPDYVVLKSDEPRQLASWLFIRWMLSPETQVRWSRETSTYPMRTAAFNLLDLRSINPQWAAAFDLLAQAKTYPKSALWSKARLVLGDGFFQLFEISPSASDINRTLQIMDNTMQELAK